MKDKGLIEFLYPNINQEYQAIQFILARKDTKQAVAWYPGKRAKQWDWQKIEKSLHKYLIGFTGRSFRSYEISKDRQSYQLHWVGIDIDDIEISKQTINKILSLLENKISQIRLSTGGHGLHLIFRLVKPVSFESGIRVGKIIKANLLESVQKLETGGIPVCCYSGGVFYMLGGKQQALYTNLDSFFDFNQTIQSNQKFDVISQSSQDFDLDLLRKQAKLTPQGRLFFKLLSDDSILQSMVACNRASIYAKRIYQALKGTKFEFETKSPMASDFAHPNGFLFKRNNNICLYINADDKIVLSFEAFEN